MKLPEENPPRRVGETAIYEDDPFDLGDAQLEIVKDFLPSPEQLAKADQVVKITIALSQKSVDFFKAQAEEHNTSYQRMIRRLIDEYVQRHQQV
jgi:predicted DNA binding CopG/RHH family protein